MNKTYTTQVLEIRIGNWLAIFMKIGYCIGYWLLSHWKYTGNMADQNKFWLAKWWNWLENGKWPTVISSIATPAAYNIFIQISAVCETYTSLIKWSNDLEQSNIQSLSFTGDCPGHIDVINVRTLQCQRSEYSSFHQSQQWNDIIRKMRMCFVRQAGTQR